MIKKILSRIGYEYRSMHDSLVWGMELEKETLTLIGYWIAKFLNWMIYRICMIFITVMMPIWCMVYKRDKE